MHRDPRPAGVGELPVEHILATLEAIERRFALTPWLYIGRFYPGSLDDRLHRFPLVLPVYAAEPKFKQLAGEWVGKKVEDEIDRAKRDEREELTTQMGDGKP